MKMTRDDSEHIPTDTQLVAGLNAGDRKAFELIYHRYASELFRHIQRNITVREDCEEILHDVFEMLWTKHRDLRIISLRPYLHKMAHNRIIRFFQHNEVRRNYERHFRLFEAVFESLVEEEKAVDPAVLQSLLDCSLPQLPERCQAAFRLRLNGLSNGEIAVHMNITKDTVENYMIKALSHLRNSYRRLRRAS